MVDIDPYAQNQQFTPRQTNVVDAVAETKRIVDAQLRANPLVNAIVDSGLTRWRGNYDAQDYVWIGEFYPPDYILDKPQRGFVIRRDDPKKSIAFAMYDWWSAPNRTLRQKVQISDADGTPMLREGGDGGAQWPTATIPLYPWQILFNNVSAPGGGTAAASIGPGVSHQNTEETMWEGLGPMTGRRLYVKGWKRSFDGGTTGRMRVKANTQGEDFFSDWFPIAGGSWELFEWDIELPRSKVGYQVQIQIILQRQSGGSRVAVWPTACHSYSLLAAPNAEV